MQAYADYYDVMQLTEELLAGLVKSVTGSYTIKYHPSKHSFFPEAICLLWRTCCLREPVLMQGMLYDVR